MKQRADEGTGRYREADERRRREAALDKTIEGSFPASDPPSTDPNPDTHDDIELIPQDEHTSSEQ